MFPLKKKSRQIFIKDHSHVFSFFYYSYYYLHTFSWGHKGVSHKHIKTLRIGACLRIFCNAFRGVFLWHLLKGSSMQVPEQVVIFRSELLKGSHQMLRNVCTFISLSGLTPPSACSQWMIFSSFFPLFESDSVIIMQLFNWHRTSTAV